MQNLKIYNGTNHSIDFYSPESYINARKDKKILKEGAKPCFTLPQQDALSSYEQLNQVAVYEDYNIPIFKRVVNQIDLLSDSYFSYDYIVVSNLYKYSIGKIMVHPLLLRRICTIEKVYSKDNQDFVVGAAGIIEEYQYSALDWVRLIQQYCGQVPLNWFSIPNMKSDLEEAKKNCSSKADMHYINYIETFINSMMQRNFPVMQPGYFISPDGHLTL